MSSRSLFFASLVLGLSLGLQTPCVFGQQYYGGRTPSGPVNPLNQRGIGNQQLTQVNLDGTITAMASGTIMVTDKTNMVWKVTVPSEAKVHVTGTAAVSYLHSGLTVEFKAEFDDKGAIKEKVSELSIISPTAEPAGIVAGDMRCRTRTPVGGRQETHPGRQNRRQKRRGQGRRPPA